MFLQWRGGKEYLSTKKYKNKIDLSKVYNINNGVDIEQAKQEIKDNVNPAKWVCVEAEKVKKINRLENGGVVEAQRIEAGDIGILYGLTSFQVGDVIGISIPDLFPGYPFPSQFS